MKTWATTIKAGLKSISGPRVFGYARSGKDWVKVTRELAQGRRAWGAPIRDVVNSPGDAASLTGLGLANVSTALLLLWWSFKRAYWSHYNRVN